MSTRNRNRIRIRARSPLLCTLLLGLAQASQGQTAPPASAGASGSGNDWQLNAGIGALAAPRYLGASKLRAQAVPLVELRWRENFFFGTLQGLGYEQRLGPHFKLSAALSADLNMRRRKDGPRVSQLDEIKLAPALRLNGELQLQGWFLGATSSTRLGRKSSYAARGSSLELEAGYRTQISPELGLGLGLTALAYDGKMAQAVLGVSPAQAAASGLRVFTPDSGLVSAGLFGQMTYQLDARWQFFAKAGLSSLSSKARLSPIVERRRQPSVMVGLSSNF